MITKHNTVGFNSAGRQGLASVGVWQGTAHSTSQLCLLRCVGVHLSLPQWGSMSGTLQAADSRTYQRKPKLAHSVSPPPHKILQFRMYLANDLPNTIERQIQEIHVPPLAPNEIPSVHPETCTTPSPTSYWPPWQFWQRALPQRQLTAQKRLLVTGTAFAPVRPL